MAAHGAVRHVRGFLIALAGALRVLWAKHVSLFDRGPIFTAVIEFIHHIPLTNDKPMPTIGVPGRIRPLCMGQQETSA